MAELAAGAVSTLLGVIRSEARLLGGVRDDVRSIQEEMESIRGFLEYMAVTTPPGGEHNAQVRTWTHQVRLLAQDCRSCIDLYLYGCNPEIHRARGGPWRSLWWWLTWLPHKMGAQHRAAIQLRQLKDRAREVSERRFRYWYSVEVPTKAAPGAQWPPWAGVSAWAAPPAQGTGDDAAEDDEEDGEDQLVVAIATDGSSQRAFFQPPTMDDYLEAKLLEWQNKFPSNAAITMSIGIIAPKDADVNVLALAFESLVFQPDWDSDRGGYHCAVVIDISAVHQESIPLGPKEVLYYILHELKLSHAKSQSLEQDTDQGKDEEEEEEEEEHSKSQSPELKQSWEVYQYKLSIYHEKKRMLNKIEENIEKMKTNKKLDKIRSDIQTRPLKGTYLQDPDVHVLLRQLLWSSAAASQQDQLKNRDMPQLLASDNAILALAKKLKKYMEADEEEREGKEEAGGGRRGVAKEVVEEGGGGGGGGKEIVVEEEEREGGGRGEEVEVVDEDDDDEDYDDDNEDDDEDGEEEMRQMAPIYLDELQYVHILRQVFPKTTCTNKSATKQATNTILGEDQIKEMIHESQQEILRLPQNGKYDKNQETGELDTPGPNTEDVFTKIVEQKVDKIKQEFREQLRIKGLVNNIKHELEYKCPLFIVKLDEHVDLPIWEDTRNALGLLRCSADVLVVTNTRDIQQARQYCYPECMPIQYSLVGLYYDTVLNFTSNRENEYNYDPQIARRILEECEPHELCMKIFAHALYANPKRSNEELCKLHNNLKAVLPKSLGSIAKKIFQFSFSGMSKEYKSCLLYLAIFPQGHKIRRSTLVGRWVAEGLITKDDWHASVRQAGRCFDALMDRLFIYPVDIGATGKVKSCVVSDLVHGFITKLAKKEGIMGTSLSYHLARHFSIFNNLHLRGSDTIQSFLQMLSGSSQLSLLKVLDLDGCRCFQKNHRYLRNICSKILMLKYLCLRGTDVTQLPSEINNLQELEILDIRQTKVPMSATRNLLLLKLKQLLAGDNNVTSSSTFSSVRIPYSIGKMVNLEVLSNVKASQTGQELNDIGKLWQLRKLGVVIDDKSSHLNNLLRAISDLHECLCSLSITLPVPSSEELPVSLEHPPKLLESLSISGTTQKGHLLPLFAGDVNNKLAKVTLSSTTLNQHNLKVLAQLPKLQFVRLRHIAITENILTIEEDEFKNLNYLLVEGSNWTKIIFKGKAVRELKKMVLSFTNIESVFGVASLQKLEEVELGISGCSSSNNGQLLSSFKNAKQLAKLTLRGTSLEQDGPQIQNQITFNKDEFPKLKLLIVEGSNLTKITFEPQAARELKKMVLSFTNIESVSGVDHLQKLEEVELSIRGGNSNNGGLLSSFNNAKQLTKLAVRGTTLEQIGPQIQNPITFNEDEFPKLKLLIVDCSAITEIVFRWGSAPKLEKIVWSSFTSLSGIDKLPRLKELEFNGVLVPQEVKEAIRKHKNKPSLKSSELKIQDQPAEQEDDDDAAGFSFCWKKQV